MDCLELPLIFTPKNGDDEIRIICT